jgi:hypothetical protein
MNAVLSRFGVAAAVIAVMWSGWAFAELSVSVTITGPIEEILPVLQHLKDLGIGTGSAPKDQAVKVEITSVASTGAPAPPPEPPKPGLLNAKVEPAAAKPGDTVLIAVQVKDPEHVVDTVAAMIEGMDGSAELYDNGSHGDATAGDGVWSGSVALKPPIAPGEHVIHVSAFNAAGSLATTKTGDQAPVPLTAQTKITVQP